MQDQTIYMEKEISDAVSNAEARVQLLKEYKDKYSVNQLQFTKEYYDKLLEFTDEGLKTLSKVPNKKQYKSYVDRLAKVKESVIADRKLVITEEYTPPKKVSKIKFLINRLIKNG